MHATEPATVHLALRARVGDLSLADVEAALYDDRSIVKLAAMRRTLFAFPSEFAPTVWASAGARVAAAYGARLAKDVEQIGATDDGPAWVAAASEAVVAALSDRMTATTTELRELVPSINVSVERSPGSTWGGSFPLAPDLLTVMHAQGQVVRAHNAGHWRLSKPSWSTTATWLGEDALANSPSCRDGYRELVGRWLHAFGPGTEDDLRWWLGGTLGIVRAALDDLGAEPVSLDDGSVGWLLADDLDEVSAPDDWVALLPTLDPTIMGWKGRDFYVGHYAPVLYDSAGNAGTSAWWNGRVVGCWVQDEPDARVRVHLLEDVPAGVRQEFDHEADRLSEWLDGVRVVTLYVSPAMRAAS